MQQTLRQTRPQVHWRWLLLLFTLSYFTMSFVVRFAWPPVIPLAIQEFGINKTAAGAFMSAFFIGYIITQIPGGVLADRFGARFVFCAALCIEALGSFGVSLSSNYSSGFCFRIISGLGGGMVFSSSIRYLYTLFSPKELSLAFGLLMTAPSGVGVIAPNLLMPWLISFLTWREAFQAIAFLSLIMACFAFVFVRDRGVVRNTQHVFQDLFHVLRQKNLLFLGFSGFWLIWATVGFVTWGNAHLVHLGFSLTDAGKIMICYGMGSVIGSPIGGFAALRVLSLKRTLLMLFLAQGPAIWFFSQLQTLPALLISAAGLGALIGLANPLTPVLMTKYAKPEYLATAGGFTSCLYQFGAMAGPPLMGWATDFTGNFQAAWIMLSLTPLMGALCLLPLSDASTTSQSA